MGFITSGADNAVNSKMVFMLRDSVAAGCIEIKLHEQLQRIPSMGRPVTADDD